jgi:hypothetical protein
LAKTSKTSMPLLGCWLALASGLWLGSCAALQPTDRVLVRPAGEFHYKPKDGLPAAGRARDLWEYAVISSNVYKGSFKAKKEEQLTQSEIRGKHLTPAVKACLEKPISLSDHWTLWRGFPSDKLQKKAGKLGLYVEVLESAGPPRTVAVVFKGTEFNSFWDWVSNLRWFNRFIPNYQDQYTVLSSDFGNELAEKLAQDPESLLGSDGGAAQLVSAGHSLGGGLAQHFAYSLPAIRTPGGAELKVSHVYAFDPSPVTGWFSVAKQDRERNAAGLEIDRVFEHGEILAYVRLLLSYFKPPSDHDPAVTEVRFNFVRTGNIIASHSMPRLACELAVASRGESPPAGQSSLPMR